MNVNMIVSATAVLVGLMVGLVFYLQSQSDDASYLVKSKWSVTTADGTAQTWLIDSESGAISISSVDGSTAQVQEFFGGKEYFYTTSHQVPVTEYVEDAAAKFCAPITHGSLDVDCELFFNEKRSTIASMEETLRDTKHSCTSEDSGSLSATTISSDGNLSVGGFIVSMVNGSPSAILDHAGNSIATINSFEDVEEVKLTGCDTSEEATYLDAIANVADSRRKLGEVDAEVMKAREMVDDIMLMNISGEERDEARRHLADEVTGSRGGGSSRESTTPGFGVQNGFGYFTPYGPYVPRGDETAENCVSSTSGQPWKLTGYRASKSALNNFGSYAGASGYKKHVPDYGPKLTQGQIGGIVDKKNRFTYNSGSQLCQGSGNVWLHRMSTKTNWCGEFSNRENTPCPNFGAKGSYLHWNALSMESKWATQITGYDWHSDGACRRHDHGIRFDYIKGGVRLGCQIDHDLVMKTRHNNVLQSIFGERDSFSGLPTWGCYSQGEKTWWARKHHTWKLTKKQTEVIRTGPYRYTNIGQINRSGYSVPFRHCHSDYNNRFIPNFRAPANYWWENNFGPNFTFNPYNQNMTWNTRQGYWVPKGSTTSTTATSASSGGTGGA